jgi:hypothetical protein
VKILGTDIEFSFGEPGPDMHRLTCVNHPEANYLTKGPGRNLHFVGWDRTGTYNLVHPQFGFGACPCPFADLRVALDSPQPVFPGVTQVLDADPTRCAAGQLPDPVLTPEQEARLPELQARAAAAVALADVQVADIEELLHTNPWDAPIPDSEFRWMFPQPIADRIAELQADGATPEAAAAIIRIEFA